jgi:hypothetical protein
MEQKKLRIKIKDLPKDMKVTREEMRKVVGGIDTVPLPERSAYLTLASKWWLVGQSGGGCGCGCG